MNDTFAPGPIRSGDLCDACGLPTPIQLLDAKPGPGHWTDDELWDAAERGEQFTRFECARCYGPGWSMR